MGGWVLTPEPSFGKQGRGTELAPPFSEKIVIEWLTLRSREILENKRILDARLSFTG